VLLARLAERPVSEVGLIEEGAREVIARGAAGGAGAGACSLLVAVGPGDAAMICGDVTAD
jgi:hypothetical protein